MFYENAGPLGVPGAVDIGIMVAADLFGFTVSAADSYGVAKYANPYDEASRSAGTWQITTLGHTEFAPLNHLAQYGWDRFATSGFTSADGLGWPLHAIGDASEPHHVAGTTAWGHRPFEDWADQDVDTSMPLAIVGPTDRANRREILVAAFRYWDSLETGKDVNHFIIDLATETKAISMANYADVYSDSASTAHVSDIDSQRAYAITSFATSEATLMKLLKQGTAATLGFLTYSSDKVIDAGDGPQGFCPPGQVFTAGPGCGPDGFAAVGGSLPPGACPADTSCGSSSPSCPSGQVLGADGACHAASPCPDGTEPNVDYAGVAACCAPGIGSCNGACCSDPAKPFCDGATKACSEGSIIK